MGKTFWLVGDYVYKETYCIPNKFLTLFSCWHDLVAHIFLEVEWLIHTLKRIFSTILEFGWKLESCMNMNISLLVNLIVEFLFFCHSLIVEFVHPQQMFEIVLLRHCNGFFLLLPIHGHLSGNINSLSWYQFESPIFLFSFPFPFGIWWFLKDHATC